MSNCTFSSSVSLSSYCAPLWVHVDAGGNAEGRCVDDLTNEQLSALLEGWNPDTGGSNNKRELLLCAVKNRLTLGLLSPEQLRAA